MACCKAVFFLFTKSLKCFWFEERNAVWSWVVFTLQLICRGCSTPPVSHCPQFVKDGNSREQRALTAALSLHQRPRHLFNFAHLLVSSQMELIAYSSLEFFELFMKAGLRLQTLKRQHNRTSSLPTACLLSQSR